MAGEPYCRSPVVNGGIPRVSSPCEDITSAQSRNNVEQVTETFSYIHHKGESPWVSRIYKRKLGFKSKASSGVDIGCRSADGIVADRRRTPFDFPLALAFMIDEPIDAELAPRACAWYINKGYFRSSQNFCSRLPIACPPKRWPKTPRFQFRTVNSHNANSKHRDDHW